MGLRDKVTLLFICVMFYQISCMPRRCKNNYAYKSRSPSPKYGKQMNRPPPKIVYNNAVQKLPVPKFKWEVPDVPEFDKNLPTASDKTWSIPNVPEFERTYGLSKLCQKSPPETVNKDRAKIPVTEWNWEVPEVPDFENSFDLSKLYLTPPPLPCKKCKCGRSISTPFDPFPEPFCFKEIGSFPEVDYPLDVNEFRIPNYWNDFIEEKLKQQGKEIDQACTQLYEGKSNTKPKPKNKAIEKAVNALLKSQVYKPATASVPSSCPGLDNSNKCNKSSDSTNDNMSPCEIEQEPVTKTVVTSSIPVLAGDKKSDSPDDLSVPCIEDKVPNTEPPIKDIVCKPTEDVVVEKLQEDNSCKSTEESTLSPTKDVPCSIPCYISDIVELPIIVEPQVIDIISKPIEIVVAQALPDPVPNIVESVISKPTEDVGTEPKQKDDKSTEKSVRPPINDKAPGLIPELVEPLLKDIIAKPIEDVIAQTLLQENTKNSTEKPIINHIVPDSAADIVEPLLKDFISNPTEDVKSKEKKEQILFHKIVSTLPEDNTIPPAEDIVSKLIENDPASLNEILCSPINCSRTSASPSRDVPSKSNNLEQNIPSTDKVSATDKVSSTDEVSKTNLVPTSIASPLGELPNESVLPCINESGVKKVLIDSLLAISNMNTSQKETLDPPAAAQNTLADDEEDFGFATLSPIDEEAPRVVRSCSYKDSSLFLCPEDLDYMLVVSI